MNRTALLVLAVGLTSFTGRAETPLDVKVGEHRALAERVTKVAIDDPAIATINSTGADTVEVVGVRRGETTLTFWSKAGQRTQRVVRVESR